MACCKCCCGGEDCVEGQQGKCCCGGVTGNCCQPNEYCVGGVCQEGCCVTGDCLERQHTREQCEEACFRFGRLDPGGASDGGYDLSGSPCNVSQFCAVYTDESEDACAECPPGTYRVPGIVDGGPYLCLKITTNLGACPDFDPDDPLLNPLCVCYDEELTAVVQALGTWETPCSEAPPP